MNKEFLLLIVIMVVSGFTQWDKYIDPAGTYKLGDDKPAKDGEIYGYFGRILVDKLSTQKIVMAFEVCKGAPSYNSGAFADTLDYYDNRAIYTDTLNDPSCNIIFEFTDKGIKIKEKTEDFNFGCGFAHGVVATGFYRKTSKGISDLIFWKGLT